MARAIYLEENPKYKFRMWIKACLGLRYLQAGLASFCDDIGREQHEKMINQILQTKTPTPNIPCGFCKIETLQPDHVRVLPGICPLQQDKCNCCFPKNKIPCPNNLCGAIYDSIIQNHASIPPAPFWRNSDAKQWVTDKWSICKCFINSPGYTDMTTAADTDCTGLLRVIINNKYFHSHIGLNLTAPNNPFSKVLQYRNVIFHSSSMELERSVTHSYIDDMISILQDGQELVYRKDAQQAVLKLRNLKKENFIITTEDFGESVGELKKELTEILKFAQRLASKDEHGIEELKKQLETQIFELKEEMDTSILETTKDQTIYKTPMLDEEIHESIDKLSKHIFLELNEYDETVQDMRALVQASSSVCKLVQGNLCATGFRVGSKYIMTSAHVADQIQEGMKSGIGPKAVFNYFKCDIPDKEDLFDIEKIVYTNTELDISVMELGKSSHPFPCPFKDFCQFSSNRVFHFVGHAEGNIMKIDHIKKIVNTTDPKVFESLAKLRKHSNDYTSYCHFDTPPYDTLENPHRVLFQCKFSHCGGGSPGIVLINGIVVVTTVLLRGYPEWYYDSLSKDYKKNWKLENCVQQGVNLASVHEKMGQTHQGLCQDIFGSSMVHVFSSPDKDEWVSDGEGWESDDIYKIDKSDKQLKPKTSKKRKSKAHVEHKRSMKRKDKVKRVSDDDGWESDDSCKFDRSSNNALKSKPWKKHKSKACVKTKRLFKRRGNSAQLLSKFQLPTETVHVMSENVKYHFCQRSPDTGVLEDKEPKWKDCIQKKDAKAARKMLDVDILPGPEELQLAVKTFTYSNEIVKDICQRIEILLQEEHEEIEYIKGCFKHDDPNKDVIFVIKASKPTTIRSLYPLYVVEENNIETMKEMECENCTGFQSEEMFQKACECLRIKSPEFMEAHSNLTSTSVSPVKMRKLQTLEKAVCIVFYVEAKGYIPIGEDVLPELIKYDENLAFVTDVREGECAIASAGPCDKHADLKMGCRIESSKTDAGGTIGCFVNHPTNGLCAITCSHVLLTVKDFGRLYKRKKEKQNVESLCTVKCYQPKKPDLCGEICDIRLFGTNINNCGMDIVLFKVDEERKPKTTAFPDIVAPGVDGVNPTLINDLLSKQMRYDPRSVMQDSKELLKRRFSQVVKYGMKTKLTSGKYHSSGGSATFQNKPKKFKYLIADLIVIKDDGGKFAEGGDSGAMVFVIDENKALMALGILTARDDKAKKTYVTPIWNILEEIEMPLPYVLAEPRKAHVIIEELKSSIINNCEALNSILDQ